MGINTESNINYNDFNSLSRLRVDARKDSQGALQEVAKQFESVFVQMMIKSMRDASVPLQGDLFHGDQSKAYTDMYDKQLGLELTKSNGIGLADVIVRQLSPQPNIPKPDTFVAGKFNQLLPAVDSSKQNSSVINNPAETVLSDIKTSAIDNDSNFTVNRVQQAAHWSTAEDFIRDSWPHAQRAGQALGVDPKVILAQSALETGWGKKVHINAQGENSYCVFGIKASADWAGKKVQFNTLEFRSGAMTQERASFRSYDSLSQSYQDYVQFLQANPRYENVLNAATPKEYSEQLQKAGYATDPDYAIKIERITESELLNKVVSELKISSKESLV
ncbi:MAG: flagellar assembly peptidoglycan hydrolase FlgJ [Gammaproteobacteria bacterium]|nr:flagellar assembly peptidoglycan hydrolase FlgJ [Gammaproteobacteria bacterium]